MRTNQLKVLFAQLQLSTLMHAYILNINLPHMHSTPNRTVLSLMQMM